MIKLIPLSSALHTVEHAINEQQELAELDDREALLLKRASEKISQIWALIRHFENDVEQGDNK